jgi:hypothetical protein
MRKALFVSLLAHGAIFGGAGPLARAARASTPALEEPADRWAGDTFALPNAGALYDVSVDGPAVHAAPAAPASPAPEAPAPAKVEPAPAPAAPPAPAPAKPAVEASHVKDPAAHAPAKPAPEASHVKDPAPAAEKPAPPKRAARKPKPKTDDEAGAPGDSAQEAGGGSGGKFGAGLDGAASGPKPHGAFGAEGAGSVRDLGYALTRSIPMACSTDPIWSTLPLGDAGKIEVAIAVDETGHITSAEPRSKDAPKALLNILRRTMPLLEAGTFAIKKGTVSAGVDVFELRAHVIEKGATDDLGHTYANGRGTAILEQPGNMRVEIAVKLLRVEAR